MLDQTSIFDFVEDNHYSYDKVLAHKRPIKLFEAFAGIGCQRMALNRLNIPYESVGISEIDKYALLAYEAIHGDCRNYGDITKMTYIPDCDIFTWSFPCTDLSKAGKQKGLINTRSGLVYEVLRLLKVTENKPKVLIMENVVDLVQVKFAPQFYEIQKELEKLGYQNYTQVLNGKDYGVAQNRERVFMVSILGGGRYEFPLREVLTKRLKDYLEDSVDEKYYLSNKAIYGFEAHRERHELEGNGFGWKPTNGEVIANTLMAKAQTRPSDNFIQEPICLNSKVNGKQPSLQDRVYDSEGVSTAITTSFMPSILIPEATKKGYAEVHDGDGVYINRPHQKRGVVQDGMIQTIKTSGDDVGVVVKDFIKENNYNARHQQDLIQHKNDVCKTINAGTHASTPHLLKTVVNDNPLRIRKLTPKECWRLMGISDEDFYKAQAVVSNSQLYKQAGNGIIVDVFEKILKGLI